MYMVLLCYQITNFDAMLLYLISLRFALSASQMTQPTCDNATTVQKLYKINQQSIQQPQKDDLQQWIQQSNNYTSDDKMNSKHVLLLIVNFQNFIIIYYKINNENLNIKIVFMKYDSTGKTSTNMPIIYIPNYMCKLPNFKLITSHMNTIFIIENCQNFINFSNAIITNNLSNAQSFTDYIRLMNIITDLFTMCALFVNYTLAYNFILGSIKLYTFCHLLEMVH